MGTVSPASTALKERHRQQGFVFMNKARELMSIRNNVASEQRDAIWDIVHLLQKADREFQYQPAKA